MITQIQYLDYTDDQQQGFIYLEIPLRDYTSF